MREDMEEVTLLTGTGTSIGILTGRGTDIENATMTEKGLMRGMAEEAEKG